MKCPLCDLELFKIMPTVYVCPHEHTKYADGKWYIRRGLYEAIKLKGGLLFQI